MCAEERFIDDEVVLVPKPICSAEGKTSVFDDSKQVKKDIIETPITQIVHMGIAPEQVKEPEIDILGILTIISVVILAFFNIKNTKKIAVETKKLEMETNSLKQSISLNQKTFIEGINSTRRSEIQKQLELFFAPFKSLRIQSASLYQIFALQAKDKAKVEYDAFKQYKSELGEEICRKDLTNEEINKYFFGVVRHLNSGKSLPKHDKKLLQQIVIIGNSLLELIERSTFVLKNSALNQLLGEYGAHIVILRMTSVGDLVNVEEAASLSMPLEVDGAIESAIMKLELEYESLMPDFKKTSPTLLESEQDTVSYYNESALDYFNRTVSINLTDIHEKFRNNIKRGGLILDAGCGIGRDTRYFIKSGYKVRSFDASSEMVKYCSQYPHAFCEQRSFLDVNELEQYDGVWANASLIHLNSDRFILALQKLAFSIKVGGCIYLSLKATTDTSNEADSRNFYYHDRTLVESILKKLCFEKIEIWGNAGRKEGQPSFFINYLFKKSTRIKSPDAR
jgi:SAM-dependent methyltransferase